MKGLIAGRICHYVLPDTGSHRPATIVHVEDQEGLCNLQVFTDPGQGEQPAPLYAPGVWFSAVPRKGSWHWVERAD